MLFPALAFFAAFNWLANHSFLGVETPWSVLATLTMFLPWVMVFVFIPVQDYRFGRDGSNPPEELMEQLENDKYYRYCTYIYIPFQYASVVFGAYLFTASDLSWLGFDGALPWPAKIGLALSVGLLGGVEDRVPGRLGDGHHARLGVLDPRAQGVGAEAAEDDRVDGA